MRILFATAHAHLPQRSGGAQTSTHELAVELIRRGHDVRVLAGLSSGKYVGLRARALIKLGSKDYARDTVLGYPTYRKWQVWDNLDHLIADISPDVAVAQALMSVRIAKEFIRHSVPSVLYFRDVESHDLGGALQELGPVSFISNSAFTANHYRETLGIESEVIPPLFLRDRYRVQREPKYVTFVNPVPVKGLDLALGMARLCPDIPFQFVESWPIEAAALNALHKTLAELPNVAFLKRTGDMRKVYRHTKLLIMPSQWNEAWGRIASEGHISGIPTLATDCGGLPESVGPGGILIPKSAGPEAWAAEIRRLWSDADHYAALSAAASAYAERPQLDIDVQMKTFVSILEARRTMDAAQRSAHSRLAARA